MKQEFQNNKFYKTLMALKPWAIFIGIFLLLKVTGMGREISVLTQGALLKAGVMDVQPEITESSAQTFDYDFAVKDLARLIFLVE